MALHRRSPGKWQVFSETGVGSGYKLHTYDPGTTDNKLTWSDEAGSVANANPIVFDSRGEADVFWSGTYDLKLTDADGALIWTISDFKGHATTGILDNSTTTAITIDASKNVTLSRNLIVGTTDTGTQSQITVKGGEAGSNEGGEIILEMAADHDTTYNNYRIDVYQDILRIGRQGFTDIILDSAGDTTFGGNVSLADSKLLYFGTGSDASIRFNASHLFIDNNLASSLTYIKTSDSVGTLKTGVVVGGSTTNVRLYGDDVLSVQTKASATYRTINFPAIPTSASGLSAGDVWSNGGVLTIV